MHAIIEYADDRHRQQVIALWKTVLGYTAAHSDPGLSIDRKLAMGDGLFFVAEADGTVVGTVMAGYDGHRGWLYSVAVDPPQRKQGLGAALVRHAEQALGARGCLKINLQIVGGNEAVSAFYASLGYSIEPRISMGKKLSQNIPGPAQAG
jgi:ribosomal protein S18 acetylase RimI-like enzyme